MGKVQNSKFLDNNLVIVILKYGATRVAIKKSY